MGFKVEKAAIIGVGLLGASLGLDLKARGLAGHVVGIGRRMASLEVALEKRAIDTASLDVKDVAGADLVVIATPAALVVPTLDAIRPVVGPSCVVTDVASTKGAICRHAAATWPAPRRFIGSHPMAGAETFGPAYGRAGFYEDSVCLVETGTGQDESAREVVCTLWHRLGARVVDVAPDRHDAILAKTSHLPHILAAAMASVAGEEGDLKTFIGNGFRDFTRIAASSPEVWRDIVLTNRDALLESMEVLNRELDAFRVALENEDGAALEALFASGRAARQAAVDS